ncbi:MAG TPA: hypothetical protein VJ949_11175 [Cryomorphaceae bacterium]|nr:hypothetical protein [Cryomorphaceae bacterium]HKL39640.1 hypothetical protein [Cryomorphaceae bacterium]
MIKSPFKYGVTVSKSAFTNREVESQKLYDNLTHGINTIIISPRRWGKSSLVEKVCEDIEQKNPDLRIISIDLFTVSSQQKFFEVFARESLKASSNKLEEWIEMGKTFFHSLIPKISIGIDPTTDFSISFDREEIKKHQDEILSLPENLAIKKDLRIVICLDEFQNLSSLKDYENLEKKMRAIWQRQKNVTYCLFGSKRHMMSDIFNDPSKPFYRFGDIISLQKIKNEKWTAFILLKFAETGKTISIEDAGFLAQSMKNHSWYVQQLAHYTWQKTAKNANKETIREALEELIAANTPLYQNETEQLSRTQLNLLKAVAVGETKFTSTRVMTDYHLGTPRNVSKNKLILEQKDIIESGETGFEFLDPAFELWFKKTFL